MREKPLLFIPACLPKAGKPAGRYKTVFGNFIKQNDTTMKSIKVQYTVQPGYVEQNKVNIKAVMDYLQANPIEGMFYACYQLEDGSSFMHINIAKDDETMSKLNEVEAFTKFRMGLKASNPISPPKSENISLVGMSWK